MGKLQLPKISLELQLSSGVGVDLADVQNSGWTDAELRVAVLQVLLAARRKRLVSGGATVQMLCDCLAVADVSRIQNALKDLEDNGCVENSELKWLITAKGVDQLIEILRPPDSPERYS